MLLRRSFFALALPLLGGGCSSTIDGTTTPGAGDAATILPDVPPDVPPAPDVPVARDAAPDVPPGPIQADDPEGVCTLRGGPGSALCDPTDPSHCPVSVDAVIACHGDIDVVRVAGGPGPRGYVSFGVVPGNRTTRLVTIDPAGGSAITDAPLPGQETTFAMGAPDGVRLVGESPGVGLAFGTPRGSTWASEPLPQADPASIYFEGAVAPDGTAYALFGRSSGHLVLAARSPAGAWSAALDLPAFARGGVTLAPDGVPLVAGWEGSITGARLGVHVGGGPEVVAATDYPASEASLQLRVTLALGTGATLPVVASWTGRGPTILVPTATGTYTAVAPPVPPPLAPSACPVVTTPCTTAATCTERQAQIVDESLGVAATEGGRVWAVYLWQQTDRDVSLTPCGGHGCRCTRAVTADRSTVILLVASVSDAAPAIRWRAALPHGTAGIDSIAARGDRLLIEVASSVTGSPTPAIRYLDLAGSRL